jgi:hypothetical protein
MCLWAFDFGGCGGVGLENLNGFLTVLLCGSF